MKLYVVRSKDGKFLRSKGYGGSGNNWVDALEKAKFFPKLGTAKAQVTFWFRTYPQFGCPEILEFSLDVAQATVLNVEAAAAKGIQNRLRQIQLRHERWAKWQAERPR